MEVVEIPLNEIYCDDEFNCRGFIPQSDIVDLAREIETQGLLNPIMVQPASDVKNIPDGYKYRCVAGHRRMAAFHFNLNNGKGPDKIPAMIRGGLNEIKALEINLGENINRKQLNIVQEARALERLRKAGLGQSDIATHLKVNRPWVQTRFYVLDFPPDIQDEITKGTINTTQIHQLHALPSGEWHEAVRGLKDARLRAGTKRVKLDVPKKAKPEDMHKVKVRTVGNINAMLDHVMSVSKPGVHTRALAWAAGNITAKMFLNDLKAWLAEQGVEYTIPEAIEGI